MRGHTKKSFKFSVKATFTITRVAPRGVLAVGSSRGTRTSGTPTTITATALARPPHDNRHQLRLGFHHRSPVTTEFRIPRAASLQRSNDGYTPHQKAFRTAGNDDGFGCVWQGRITGPMTPAIRDAATPRQTRHAKAAGPTRIGLAFATASFASLTTSLGRDSELPVEAVVVPPQNALVD